MPEDEQPKLQRDDLVAEIPDDKMPTWESQAAQYPRTGSPGISYFRGEVTADYYVDCLLYRDDTGELVGVLNHYPDDLPPYETKGNVNIWVHPNRRRQGIGTDLLEESFKRWRPPQTSKVSETGVEWLRGIGRKYAGGERELQG